MNSVCLNPLSACWQHYEIGQAEVALFKIISCFQYIRLALEHDRATLIYDDSIEQRGLVRGSGGILSEINNLPNRDLRIQWFLYTKNHAVRADLKFCTIIIVDADNDQSLKGEIRDELLSAGVKWLSFGGSHINEQTELEVSTEVDSINRSIPNAFCLETFVRWWPQYEASPKHRKQGYFEGGEWVSPMPLDERTAQDVLMISIIGGTERYGYYQGEYYRFPRTHADREIFHGFSITRADVPPAVLDDIED